MNPKHSCSLLTQEIGLESPLLDEVKQLWRVNSDTLGFFPDGAFDEYAGRRQIIVVAQGDLLLGYVLYRLAKDRAAIVHLCVDSGARGKGLAAKLVAALHERTDHLAGIALRCRRDFPANAIWPKLGFVAHATQSGKGIRGEVLTSWWRDNDNPNLFSGVQTTPEPKLMAVLDMNIVFDLKAGRTEESMPLLADWLTDRVELQVTDEALNEVNRIREPDRRREAERFVRSFPIVSARPDAFLRIQREIRPLFPRKMNKRDESDRRQLAKTIAADVSTFVTRDARLLAMADAIHELYGVNVLNPWELVTRLDALLREDEYQPVRLAGTQIQIKRTNDIAEGKLVTAFLNYTMGESRGSFVDKLRACLADPVRFESMLVTGSDQEPVALVVLDTSPDGSINIPFFRARSTSTALTLIRHLIVHVIRRAVALGKMLTVIDDTSADGNVRSVLGAEFKLLPGGRHLKVHPAVVATGAEMADRLSGLALKYGFDRKTVNPFGENLRTPAFLRKPEHVLQFETDLWPAKLEDGSIENFIVSIRPEWAKHFFAHDLAEDDLFGADESIAMNRQAAYYRAAKPGVVRAPGRILWYVSKGVGEIRAASLISEVKVGPPKELFRRYRRLGIYQWRDLRNLVSGNLQAPIMGILFGETEPFEHPIPSSEAKATLSKAFDISTLFLSPTRIPREAFFALYSMGIGRDER